jgi:hypothetical protein
MRYKNVRFSVSLKLFPLDAGTDLIADCGIWAWRFPRLMGPAPDADYEMKPKTNRVRIVHFAKVANSASPTN